VTVLAVAAVGAAVATGSIGRGLPAGFSPGTVALPSGTAAETPLSGFASPVATAAARAVPSASHVPSPGPAAIPTPVPSAIARPVIHITKPGESLTSIAALYGVTPQAIRRANHLRDANLLRIGQKLVIPRRG
jgi:LysM repeat protein